MVYIKPEFIRYQKSMDLADTFKFDEMPSAGKSAGLILKIDCPTQSGQHYNYANAGDKFRLVDWIDEVKIVTDGKRALKDLNGAILQGLEYWNKGRTAVDQLADRTLYGDHCLIPIAWGRRLHDLEYYLNYADYSSFELQVKNILNSTLHGSATIDIINLKIMDEEVLPSSKGVFKERIWREWTTVANETKYLKPPAEDKLRRIILRAVPDQESSSPYRRSCNFMDLMNEIKLGFHDYGEIAFDGYATELMEKNALEFPHEVHTCGTLLAMASGGSEMIRTGIGRMRSMQVSKAEVGTSVTEMNFGIYTYLDDLKAVYYDTGTNQYVHWDCYGLGYMNMLAMLFDYGDCAHLLDQKDKKTINLDIKTKNDSTAADGTNQVILSELVSK